MTIAHRGLLHILRDGTPRWHGNGFIQLPLPSGRRMHVWDPEMTPIPDHNAVIHNHVWDMQSRVVHGILVHRTLAVDAHLNGTHDVWGAGEGGPDRIEWTGTPRITGEYHMSAGSVYVFPQGEFHETEHRGITVTVIEKRPVERHTNISILGDVARPLVVCPRGQHPVDAFDPSFQPPQEAMWRLIDRAVGELSPSMRIALMESAS